MPQLLLHCYAAKENEYDQNDLFLVINMYQIHVLNSDFSHMLYIINILLSHLVYSTGVIFFLF